MSQNYNKNLCTWQSSRNVSMKVVHNLNWLVWRRMNAIIHHNFTDNILFYFFYFLFKCIFVLNIWWRWWSKDVLLWNLCKHCRKKKRHSLNGCLLTRSNSCVAVTQAHAYTHTCQQFRSLFRALLAICQQLNEIEMYF